MKSSDSSDIHLYEQLKGLAESLGIAVREEAAEGMRGGLFVFKGQKQLLVNKESPVDAKADLLIECLKKEDLSAVYVLPAIRDLLDKG